MQVPAVVRGNGAGSCVVEYAPVTVGEHNINVVFFGNPIQGSPFICNVSDWSKIFLTNLRSSTTVGKKVEFDIDAAQAGPGELEIMVNEGTVQCTVQNTGNKKFRASFVPREPGPHRVVLRFNGEDVPAGPWVVDVRCAVQATINFAGMQIVSVNRPAIFEVRTGSADDGKIVINVTSPSGRLVRCNVSKKGNGVYKVDYVPNEVGNYSIEVIYDGLVVPGCPFISKACDGSAIKVSPIPSGEVGKPVEFTIDAIKAGEGQLEITVEHGSIPNSAQMMSKGIFKVSFIPKEAKPHIVEICFNSKLINGGSIMVPVIDLSQITVQGDCSRLVPVNRSCLVTINTQLAGEADLTIRITSPSTRDVPCRINGSSKKGYEIDFTPTETGAYKINGEFGGMSLPFNPILVSAYDVTKIKITNIQDGFVNQQSMFRVDVTGAGEGELEFAIFAPSGSRVPSQLQPINESSYNVCFVPIEFGIHQISGTFNGEQLIGSPYKLNVFDVSKALARGDGLTSAACNQVASFFLTAPAAVLADFDIKISGPGSKDITARCVDTGRSTFRVDYTPQQPGEYKIDVSFHGQEIYGSPFTAKAWDINKVIVSNVTAGKVGETSTFNINVRDAGDGTLEIGISGPSGLNITNTVSTVRPGQFLVTYVPLESGPHKANITFNSENVPGNPFAFNVFDPNKAMARGDGLGSIPCNQPTSFIVTASGAQAEDTEIKITGPGNQDIVTRIRPAADGTFKVEYTPIIAGDYNIDIACFGQRIPNSPFIARAWDSSKVLISNVNAGNVGVQSSFTIDCTAAGDGTLEIAIKGPSGQNISNNVTASGPGIFLVSCCPRESGLHRATVTFNKEDVSGSPVSFLITDSSRASVRGDGLGVVKANTDVSFTVTAPEATLKDVDIHIVGPNGKYDVPKITELGSNCFKADYIPTVAGNYTIDISYFGQPLSGSPFEAKVWDASKLIVSNVSQGRVGIRSTFCIDCIDAGEGTLEIGICSPSGQNIQNSVSPLGPGRFEVAYVPAEFGQHKINILFNRENIPGNPFNFSVSDVSKVTVKGDGIGLVRCSQATVFYVYAPGAQVKDLNIDITGPGGNGVPQTITDTGNGNFKIEYTPTSAGDYNINVFYFDQLLSICPFTAKAWDPSKVTVSNFAAGRVGVQSTCQIDTRDAGTGSLEISISGPSGRLTQCQVAPVGMGRFDVIYNPIECGQHKATVLFNKENASGSPYLFLVTDPSKASVRGDGIGLVRCQQAASFMVTAPGASLRDVIVQITGPDSKNVMTRTSDSSIDTFLVEYTPVQTGDYAINVTYFSEQINGCPFVANAWDPSMVQMSNLTPGCIGKVSHFSINASKAGVGNLEIAVSVSGESIPNMIKAIDKATFDVSFTPYSSDVHTISVKFNGEMITGSPFSMTVLDGSKATASGDGLIRVYANTLTSFDVNTRAVGGEAELEVRITSPRGQELPAKITGSGRTGYRVEYTAVEAGKHHISINYAGASISGSPFYPCVTDPTQIRVSQFPQGVVDQLFSFDVDATMAGEGTLSADVRGQITKPLAEVTSRSNGLYTVSFLPREAAPHSITLTFNGIKVPGSPFPCSFIDANNLHVRWETVRLRPVNQPVFVDLDAKGSADADFKCTVKDPFGGDVSTMVGKQAQSCRAEFVPKEVGPYTISLLYGGVLVPGSPYTCNIFDSNKVQVSDTSSPGHVGREMSFTVDTSLAGMGDLDVAVNCNEVRVPTQSRKMNASRICYTFVPVHPVQHTVVVTFNDITVPNTPMNLSVVNPAGQLVLVSVSKSIPVGQQIVGLVTTQNIMVSNSDITTRATSPDGDSLAAKMSTQADGTIRVEFSSKKAGPHTVEALYCGQAIAGSPFVTEVFDPSKIVIQGVTDGMVGEQVSFDILYTGAGKADLDLMITSMRGAVATYNKQRMGQTDHITYTPNESGLYSIQVTYGGLDVPGCPIHQKIMDNFLASAYGDGLLKGIENQLSCFFVDGKGRPGELSVDIEGPNSLAKCNIERDQDSKYKVTYTPIEVGPYIITINWNAREIHGSPYKANIIGPERLTIIGGWGSLIDAGNEMNLTLHEKKTFQVDARLAGSDQLRAEVLGPDGMQFCEVYMCSQNIYSVSFVPHFEGEYRLNLYYGDQILQRCPIVGTVIKIVPVVPELPAPIPQPTLQLIEIDILQQRSAPEPVIPVPQAPKILPQNVIVIGPGLTNARICEKADFLIDGTSAGPGMPLARLNGLKCDVDVFCMPVDANRYRCSYTAFEAGAYLLTVMWSGFPVPMSPFKVTVTSGTKPEKVSCDAETMRRGLVNQEVRGSVDTRRAGPGNLAAQCSSPCGKYIDCRLVGQGEGLFSLIFTPKKAGTYFVTITYSEVEIPGSPFAVVVTAPLDASKVRVTGPGVQSGILATFKSFMMIETSGAGPGQLTVRMRGRAGTFRVELSRDPQNDRVILCKYNPTEVGTYTAEIKWSGQHVPGSPFSITIFDTRQELDSFMSNDTYGYNGGGDDDGMSAGGFDRAFTRSAASSNGRISGDAPLMFNDDC